MTKLTPTESLLRFLESRGATGEDEESLELFDTLVAFVQQEELQDIKEALKEKITCKYPDFMDYFESTSKIQELMDMKEENPEKYYTIVHHANIILNLLCSLFENNQTIVLNPENLYKSYFLVIKLKN